MKKFSKPIIALVIFLATQVVMSFAVVVVAIALKVATDPTVLEALKNGDSTVFAEVASNANVLSSALILSSIITILLMIKPLGMFSFKQGFKPSGVGIKLSVIAIVAAFFGMFGSDLINAAIKLPNIIEAQLNGMSATFLGALAISIVGPLAEEVVFRGAMMGYMLKQNVSPTVAILVSALLFGLMHINPAQVPFAMIVGVILGVIYYRTGNIILTTIIHVINNSIATILANISDGSSFTDDMSMGASIGCVIAGLVGLAICYLMLRKFWNGTETITYSANEDIE